MDKMSYSLPGSGTFRTNLNLLVAKAAEDYTGLYHMIRSSHDGGSHYEVPIMKGLPTLKTAFRMSGDTLSVQLWVRVHSYPMGGSYNILRLIGYVFFLYQLFQPLGNMLVGKEAV